MNTPENEAKRKKRWKGPAILMTVGGVLFIGGIVGYFAVFFMGLMSMHPDDRVVVPGTVTVQTDPGNPVSIYAESSSEINGQAVFGPNPIPGLQLVATDQQGNSLAINMSPSGSYNYASFSHAGSLIAETTGSPGGAVTIDASLAPGTQINGTPVIAVSSGNRMGAVIGMIFGSLALMILAMIGGMTFIGGFVWLIVVLAMGASRG